MVKGIAPDGSVANAGALIRALTEYAKMIEPWADAVAGFMVADVARRDRAMWAHNSKDMARALGRELQNAPTGDVLRRLQADQVTLIKSIPLEAAKRVQDLAERTLLTSGRADGIAREILATSDVTESRARLIARTEVSRASSNLLQARATWAGSDGYTWRTSGDDDVRPSHAAMEGVYVRW